MKKLFLIPLMALMTCVMAWATDAHVSSIADLSAKLLDASVETIYLDADLTYTNEACINILRSVTIDGQGHKISGGGIRTGTTKSTMAINQGAPGNENWIDLVTLKNITLQNAISAGQALNVRCNLTKLVIENCTIKTTGSGNNQPITFGGNQSTPVELIINDSYISSGQAGYPVITFNPIALNTKNTTYQGYCALYFKGVNSSAGSGGSSVVADACEFKAPNMNAPAGGWNSFGVFVFADGGITMELNNCGFNSQEIGSDQQQVFLFTYEGSIASIDPCVIHITGDNSHINGDMLRDAQQSARAYFQENYDPNAWNHVIEIAGGTYAQDPSTVVSGDLAITIKDGYEVKAIKYEEETLYRVVKKAQEKDPGVLYDLNDYVPVEGEGYGDNPVSSFELSNGAEKTLNNEKTYAGYVQVKDNEDTDKPTVLTVDKTLDDKDQRLIINKGLDVQGESQVVVKAGAAVIIGEGGINTEKPENIVIESTEDEQAALLLDPTISVNKNPELTVRLTTNSKMLTNAPTYLYQRMAIPVLEGMRPHNEFDDEGHGGHTLFPGQSTFYSYFYKWGGHEWEPIESWGDLKPYVGYQMSNNSADGGVIYTFTGNLIGNDDAAYEFTSKGFEFFGNSYTAPIVIKNLLDGFAENSPGVEATVYVYVYGDYNTWVPITSEDIEDGFALATEIRSMDCFILNLRNGNSGTANMSYADAIWNNPRINPSVPAAGAPARAYASSIDNSVVISVTSEGGQGDRLTLIERQTNDATFENGADASKFITDGVNIYAETPAGQLSRVATNDLEGTQITFVSNASEQFTLKFSNVNGTRYALRDNANGQIISLVDDATYNFTQAANTSVANRFEVVAVEHVVTGVESTKANSGVKGIYTVLGQYVGSHSQWNSLPAGVYVVDGVKMVK